MERILIAVLLLVRLPVFAQAPQVNAAWATYAPSADQYMSQCGHPDALVGGDLYGCVGFMNGAWAGFIAGLSSTNEQEQRLLDCVPNGPSGTNDMERLRVVVTYLTAHPEDLHHSAGSEIPMAFLSLYCPAKKSPAKEPHR
jgi:hypothetical protein